MPEYAFAIDLYARQARHVHVQEYAPPKTVNQESARERRREALAVLPEVLSVPLAQVHSRVRKPQKGAEQYEKRESASERHAMSGRHSESGRHTVSGRQAVSERHAVSEGGLK